MEFCTLKCILTLPLFTEIHLINFLPNVACTNRYRYVNFNETNHNITSSQQWGCGLEYATRSNLYFTDTNIL